MVLRLTKKEAKDLLRRVPRGAELLRTEVDNVATEMALSEEEEQVLLIDFCEQHKDVLPDLEWLFHIANGGKRHWSTAKSMKRMGVKAGVLDLFLPVCRNGYHGLWIEMKRGAGAKKKSAKGKVRDTQQRWIEHLRKEQYCVHVMYSWKDAASAIITYLGGNPADYEEL